MLISRIASLGKHPVSTTIDIDLNKEVDELCKGKCSKYQFIRDAITEKVEKIKIERRKENERHSEGENRQPEREDTGVREDSGETIINDID